MEPQVLLLDNRRCSQLIHFLGLPKNLVKLPKLMHPTGTKLVTRNWFAFLLTT